MIKFTSSNFLRPVTLFVILSVLSVSAQSPKRSQVFCDSFVRPDRCSRIYHPVCSITEDNDCYGNDCVQTVSNSCTACRNSSIVSYITGECFDLTQPENITCNPNFRPETCGTKTDFVCAVYTNGSNSTLPSPCYACRDSSVEYYVSGICPQDSNKTFCSIENLPPPCPPPPIDYYAPVCAYVRNCTEEPCRYTANYACPVCASNTVDYYTQGECQISCAERSIEEFCSDESPQPVCAYTKDCTGDSCRRTMDSSCVACSDSTVDYFSDGVCYQPPTEEVAP